jgi:hypothetical protein
MDSRSDYQIKEEMKLLGYNPDNVEVQVYRIVGCEQFFNYVYAIWKASCIEADFLEIRRHEERYQRLLLENRRMAMNEIYTIFRDYPNIKLEFVCLPDDEIKKHIERKYSGKNKKSL